MILRIYTQTYILKLTYIHIFTYMYMHILHTYMYIHNQNLASYIMKNHYNYFHYCMKQDG